MKALLVAALLCLAAPARAQTTFFMGVKTSLTRQLPKCYGPDCQGKLIKVIKQISNSTFAYGDAWIWYAGATHHAHVWRVPLTVDWDAWLFQGSTVWWKGMRWWADQDKTSSVIGPMTYADLAKLPSVQCETVASKVLINVTSDAGTVVQPPPTKVQVCTDAKPVAPSDAGPGQDVCHWTEVATKWPKEQLVVCDKTTYLARSRHGGTWGSPPDDGGLDPNVTSAKEPPPAVGTNEKWEQPDAATTKVCPSVPVQTPCP